MHILGGAQSVVLLVQAPLQAPAAHRNGEQFIVVGLTQVPAPSQVDLPVANFASVEQVAAAQVVPLAYFWQAPASHLPLLPQPAAPWSLHIPAGSALPFGTLVHVPRLPDRLQDWQAPPQAELQQTPWAQKPLLHWEFEVQLAPPPDLPHEFDAHRFGVKHCESVAHELKHLLPLQTNGAQASVFGVTHLPAPSQVEMGV